MTANMITLQIPSPALPSAPSIAPAVTTRAQVEALLENIARLRGERDELHRAMEIELEAVRQRYRAPLAEIDRYLDLETSWAEGWARENSGALDAERSLVCGHATIGFRTEPPRIERASRRWTWTRIAAVLGGLEWGRRYLRTPVPEVQVDKEAIVADLAKLSPVELRNAGIRVEQGERFFITTRGTADTEVAPQLEHEWQEAA
jgi:hypothetical protein